ncbi:DHHC family palmitoyl transferase [Cryptosporidium xiaoi]|uniref:Palmitoyltransferase n=1 Tax=Cryptosporidium xiaoi TaxID=659607 RepID=A0AAV9Y1S9_9CRYT
MVRYRENDISSYNDNPLGLLPSRFIANSRSHLNITGILVCLLRFFSYYPVWLLLNNTESRWYFDNGPFLILLSLVLGLINNTLYVLISFGDPGFLRSCPSSKLRPVDRIRDPLGVKYSIELKGLDNKQKGFVSGSIGDNVLISDTLYSSEEELNEDENIDVLGNSVREIDYCSNLGTVRSNKPLKRLVSEGMEDEKRTEEVISLDSSGFSNGDDALNQNLNIIPGNTIMSFPLLNANRLISSSIRIDKSTASLSLAMESAPGHILNSIGVSQFKGSNNLFFKERKEIGYFENDKLDQGNNVFGDSNAESQDFIIGIPKIPNKANIDALNTLYDMNKQINRKKSEINMLFHSRTNLDTSLTFPLSPCSSDGIDFLPRKDADGTDIVNSYFQSDDGFFVFKQGKMYQNGVRLRFCDYCRMYQPLRTKHCSSCERCIRTHDHHCPWLGICIGEYNRCKFWWLSLVQAPECIWVLYCTYLCLFKVQLTNNHPSLFEIISLIAISGNALFIGFLSLLLVVYHFFLAFNNLTTWENLAWSKISYLKPFPDTQSSPFSRGYLYNIAVFCIPHCVDDLIIGEEGEIIWERNQPEK